MIDVYIYCIIDMFKVYVDINTGSMLWDMYDIFITSSITEIFLVHNICQYLKHDQLEDQVANKKQLQKVTWPWQFCVQTWRLRALEWDGEKTRDPNSKVVGTSNDRGGWKVMLNHLDIPTNQISGYIWIKWEI